MFSTSCGARPPAGTVNRMMSVPSPVSGWDGSAGRVQWNCGISASSGVRMSDEGGLEPVGPRGPLVEPELEL